MRINSATRSDVFNEYVKIISNFNLKHNKTASATGDIAEDVAKIIEGLENAKVPNIGNNAVTKKTFINFWDNILKNIDYFDLEKIGLKPSADLKGLIEMFKKPYNEFSVKTVNGVEQYYLGSKTTDGWKICNSKQKDSAIEYLIKDHLNDFKKVTDFRKALTTSGESNLTEFLKDDVINKIGRGSASVATEAVQEATTAPSVEPPNVGPAKSNGTTGDTPVPDPAEVLPQASRAAPPPSTPRARNSVPIDELYNKVGIDNLKPILEDLLSRKDFIGFYTNIAMKSSPNNADDMLKLVNSLNSANTELANFTKENDCIYKLAFNQKLDKEFVQKVMASVPDKITSKEISDFLKKIETNGDNISKLSDDFLNEISSRPSKSEIISESLGSKEDLLKGLNLTDLQIGSELIIPRSDGRETLATFLGFYEGRYPRFSWQEDGKEFSKFFKSKSDIEKIKLPDGSPIRSALAEPVAPAPTPAAATPAPTAAPPAAKPAPTPAAVEATEQALVTAASEDVKASAEALKAEVSTLTNNMATKIVDIEGKLSSLETSLKTFRDPEIAKVSADLAALRSELKTLSEKAAKPAAAPVAAEEAKGLFSRIKEVLSERLITRLKGTPAAKVAEEAAATAVKSAKEAEALAAAEKRVKEAEEALKAAKSATTKSAEAAATSQAAKSIGSALKTLAGVGLAVGATYAVYKAVTGEDMPEEIADPTSSIGPVETGVPGSSENPINPNNSSEVSNSLSTPEGRANIQGQLNSLANSNPNSYNKLLSSMEKIFGATGKYKLERPIRIKGERIEYVFPRQAAGSRNPLDPGRAKAAEEYMYKLLENKGRKASNIKGRILTDANSENPMEIANYMFSTIANKGLFKGLGTGRAGRYGRGAGIREIENKGFSGSQEERMTRKERRALRNISRNQFDQGDETPLSDSFDSSPIESFSSGYNELFEKYSSDLDNSINNSEIMKKADKTSKRYFKDAVKDLSSDSFMSDYYAGFSKLYDSKVKKKKSDYSKLYDVQEETGSNRIHKAHPEAIVVADAIGNGGLVENASESSKAMQDVASRMPTGNYRARYAFIQNALKKASS